MAEIIPFPAGRVDHSVDVDRSVTEPAIILILPVVRVERCEHRSRRASRRNAIVSAATEWRVRMAMRRLLAPASADTGDETD
jgi:hypothetical protein